MDTSEVEDSEREQELTVLASIYPTSDFQRVPGEFTGVGLVSPNLSDGIAVHFNVDGKESSQASDTQLPSITLAHLPAFVLTFQLPEDYPERSPPQYTLTCKWLSPQQLTAVCKRLDELYLEVGDVVIYTWLQFLRDDVMDFLSLAKDGERLSMAFSVPLAGAEDDDSRVCRDEPSLSHLHRFLRTHDEDQRAFAFASSYHECEVCFMTRAGNASLQFLPCRHSFCNECMKSYFEVQIGDGSVTSLNCPASGCESQALPTQVKALVPRGLYEKYERLLLQRGLESMEEIVLCPLALCQQPVVKDGGGTNVATCGACKLSFCVLCRRVWHGVNPCPVSNKERTKLVKAYRDGTPEQQKALIAQYGTRLQRYIEESVSEEWLSENSKACPSCGCHIQKTEGCNKMTCRRCRNYFCWMCLANLNKANPYAHYSDRSGPCYNRLFDGADIDDDGGDIWEDEG